MNLFPTRFILLEHDNSSRIRSSIAGFEITSRRSQVNAWMRWSESKMSLPIWQWWRCTGCCGVSIESSSICFLIVFRCEELLCYANQIVSFFFSCFWTSFVWIRVTAGSGLSEDRGQLSFFCFRPKRYNREMGGQKGGHPLQLPWLWFHCLCRVLHSFFHLLYLISLPLHPLSA